MRTFIYYLGILAAARLGKGGGGGIAYPSEAFVAEARWPILRNSLPSQDSMFHQNERDVMADEPISPTRRTSPPEESASKTHSLTEKAFKVKSSVRRNSSMFPLVYPSPSKMNALRRAGGRAGGAENVSEAKRRRGGTRRVEELEASIAPPEHNTNATPIRREFGWIPDTTPAVRGAS